MQQPLRRFFGVEAGKAVTPVGVMAALNLYGVTQADQRQATAWVNFNGTGTVAIRGAYNVSSITDNGTGDYTINFTTPMNNTDYACAMSCERGSENTITGAPMLYDSSAKTPNSVRIRYMSSSSGTNKAQMSLIVFGGK